MSGGSSIESEGKRHVCQPKRFPRPPEVDRPHNPQEQIAHLERLCGQQALERGSAEIGGRCLKKSLALGLATGFHPSRDTLSLNGFGSRCRTLESRKLCRSLGVNRQWYYQHRCPSAHQEYDQRLRAAI
jgi:hypothetical protein